MYKLVTMTAVFCALSLSLISCGNMQTASPPKMEIGEVQVNPDIKLRRMIYRPSHPKGTVLFLHGFPETLYDQAGLRFSISISISLSIFNSLERHQYSP
jgi:hypothetical protein